ncbi:hypothetical protein VTN77DRAFT_7714 [Rasamsonia byssochlamydoides]|uniref:uncharacterized protein n=1 Tax=Rasamsonia byssochlamydoides TaxID=89139 RepID=UPI003742BE37
MFFEDGSPVPVLGYMYGTWIDSTLRTKWTGLEVYVVQARFHVSNADGGIDLQCHFVLNPDDLCRRRRHQMSAEETRSMCLFLNPSLYRLTCRGCQTPWVCTAMGSWQPEKFKGVTVPRPDNSHPSTPNSPAAKTGITSSGEYGAIPPNHLSVSPSSGRRCMSKWRTGSRGI